MKTNLGLDLNHSIPFPANFADYSLAFVWHKATQGTRFVDPLFMRRRALVEAAGIPFAAYHFGTGDNVEQQVDNFLSTLHDPIPTMALDWEDNGKNTMTEDQAREFLRQVQERTGLVPYLYGSDQITFSNAATVKDPIFSQAKLWLCAPCKAEGPLPSDAAPHFTALASWPTISVWQYSDDGPGYAKPPIATFFPGADWNQVDTGELTTWAK